MKTRVPRQPLAMVVSRCAIPRIAVGATMIALVATVQCSPTTPSPTTLGVSNVALTTSTIPVGTTGQGTVSLTTTAVVNGASVSLSSSNPAVATVETSVAIPAGASSVTFNVLAVAPGTARITASLNGSNRQSSVFQVMLGPTLTSISLSSSSVVGGNWVTGTATLSAAAPAGGAVVSLSANDPVIVPPNVTVPAGSTSVTFAVSTRVVSGTIAGTVSGSYGGASASAVLSVTRPTVATANFGVAGPTQSDTCTMADNGTTLNCTFNGSTSTAPGTIVTWEWSFGIAKTFAQTTSGPVLTMPSVDCSLMPPPPLPAGDVQWFNMIVTLRVRDDLGNVSPVSTNSAVRLLPQGVCGF